jgi:hypothetical protein
MAEETEPSSQEALDKFSAPNNFDQRYYGQYGQSSNWADPGSSSMMSPSSPLARRIADWGLLMCPCCGFGVRQQEGMFLEFLHSC